MPLVGATLSLFPDGPLLVALGRAVADERLVGGPCDGDLWNGAALLAQRLPWVGLVYREEDAGIGQVWGAALTCTQCLSQAREKELDVWLPGRETVCPKATQTTKARADL